MAGGRLRRSLSADEGAESFVIAVLHTQDKRPSFAVGAIAPRRQQLAVFDENIRIRSEAVERVPLSKMTTVRSDRLHSTISDFGAGEIVNVDRKAWIVGHMRQIEWNGSRHGVFFDDFLERTDKLKTGAGTN